jgi:hypothetical protein
MNPFFTHVKVRYGGPFGVDISKASTSLHEVENLKGPYMEPSSIGKNLTAYYYGGKTKTKCPPPFS